MPVGPEGREKGHGELRYRPFETYVSSFLHPWSSGPNDTQESVHRQREIRTNGNPRDSPTWDSDRLEGKGSGTDCRVTSFSTCVTRQRFRFTELIRIQSFDVFGVLYDPGTNLSVTDKQSEEEGGGMDGGINGSEFGFFKSDSIFK